MYSKSLIAVSLAFAFTLGVAAQSETLTNTEVILMTRAGLSKELIVRKVKDSNGKFDTTAQGLIDLKKAGVSDDVIALMFDKDVVRDDIPGPIAEKTGRPAGFSENVAANSYIVLEPNEAFLNAKTVAIEKSSIHPSRQALEKELMKRAEWKALNLNIVRHKDAADLLIEIGRVPFSWISHRYVWRIYDNKSGTVIIAGETTSWGSLAKNIARDISKKAAMVSGK